MLLTIGSSGRSGRSGSNNSSGKNNHFLMQKVADFDAASFWLQMRWNFFQSLNGNLDFWRNLVAANSSKFQVIERQAHKAQCEA